MKKLENYIDKIILQLRFQYLLKAMLVGLSVYLIVISFGEFVVLGLVLGTILGCLTFWLLGGLKDQRKKAIGIAHSRSGGLEYSLELLGKKQKTIADQLQLARIEAQFHEAPLQLYFKRLGPFLIACLVSFSIFGLSKMPTSQSDSSTEKIDSRQC